MSDDDLERFLPEPDSDAAPAEPVVDYQPRWMVAPAGKARRQCGGANCQERSIGAGEPYALFAGSLPRCCTCVKAMGFGDPPPDVWGPSPDTDELGVRAMVERLGAHAEPIRDGKAEQLGDDQ